MNLLKKAGTFIYNPVNSLQFIHLLRFTTLFLISIAFAKSNYSVTDIGVYEKFIYFAGALSFFWTNGIIQAFLSLFHRYSSQRSQNNLIANCISISLLFSFIIVALLFAFEKPLSLFFINSEQLPYKLIFIFYMAFAPVTFFIEYIYLVKKQYKSIFHYGVSTYVVQLVLLIVPSFIYNDLSYSLWGLLIVTITRFIWLAIIILKNHSFNIDFYEWRIILKNSSPLILSAFIAGSLPYIDGILVASHYDDSIFAIFRYGAREFPISVLLANAFSNAMIPIINSSQSITASLVQIKKKSLQLMHVLFPVSIILLISSYLLFEIAFNPHFLESAKIFNVMLLLVIPRMVFPQTILIAKRYQNLTLIASIIEWVVKLFFSLWMMTFWGIFGIAMATVVAFFVEKIVLAFFVYKRLKILPKHYIPITWFIFYSTILLISFIIIEHTSIFG